MVCPVIFTIFLQIDALRDLKVKQEELCKNERMTRKKMITSMRAIQVCACVCVCLVHVIMRIFVGH